MNWITVIWSIGIGATMVLALIHFLACYHQGFTKRASGICFAGLSLGIIGLSLCELATMQAESPQQYVQIVRIGHLVFALTTASSLCYVHLDFGTGRKWLLWVALGMRAAAVVANYTTGDSLHFLKIDELGTVNFLGEQVKIVATASQNPWVRIGQVAAMLQMIYIADASIGLWRTGGIQGRKRAIWIGGSMVALIFVAFAVTGLIAAGMLRAPLLVSFPFFGMVLAIGYEVSKNLIDAARLSKELESTQQRMTHVCSAGHLAFWEWCTQNDCIAILNDGWKAFGIYPTSRLSFHEFMNHVHDDDREYLENTLRDSVLHLRPFSAEFRVLREGDTEHWLSMEGRISQPARATKTPVFHGFTTDITARKRSEAEASEQRRILNHLSRVVTLGELAGALAHELNQPLAAILSNAEVASCCFTRTPPELKDMQAMLSEIVGNAERAGNIIHSMRAMLVPNAEAKLEPLDVSSLILATISLLSAEISARKGHVEFQPPPSSAVVMASHVELQQVMVNLIMNGLEAFPTTSDGHSALITPRLTIRCIHLNDMISIQVEDNGQGITAEDRQRIFTPFFTTKSERCGLGLGLSISRNIIRRFGGDIEALPQAKSCGAIFEIRIPALVQARVLKS